MDFDFNDFDFDDFDFDDLSFNQPEQTSPFIQTTTRQMIDLICDISNLQTTLDSKASTSHTHTSDKITEL